MSKHRKKKIVVVINNRANFARIKSVMQAIKDHDSLSLQVAVGASALLHRYGMTIETIEDDGFRIDAKLYSVVEGENPTTMAKSTGLAIIELATLFENLRPDAVLTVADRFETLATAVAASYMNIPLVHTQGGEVTGSIDESVRHAITKLAHLHFPATEKAAKNIIQMGENASSVHMVGCPAIDLVAHLDLSVPDQQIMPHGVGFNVDLNEPYLVVLQHPVTTEYGNGLQQIEETISAIKTINHQTIWLWPNIDAGSDEISKGLRLYRENTPDSKVGFFRSFSPELYAKLIVNCGCLIGNSSSAIREGSFLGVPAVNIGTRQNKRESGDNVINAKYDRVDIESKILYQLDHGPYLKSTLYGDGNSGQAIAEILAKSDISIQKVLSY